MTEKKQLLYTEEPSELAVQSDFVMVRKKDNYTGMTVS